MQEKTELRLMLYFTLAYLALFTTIAVLKHNYEFIFYSSVMVVLILLVSLYHKKLHLSTTIIGGLCLLGTLHIFGGNLHIGTTRLYDYWIIPSLFKYDNLVHTIGIFVSTIIAYNLLNPHLDQKIEHNKFFLSLLLILIASGIGAFNEILELGAVVFFNAAAGVGGYMNNAIDLVFNVFGAVIACFVVTRYHKKKHARMMKAKP